MKEKINEHLMINNNEQCEKDDEGKSNMSELVDIFIESTKDLVKKGHIRRCLHPNQSECSGTIVRAHAIQNNRILKKIGDNGIVITTNGVSNLFFQDANPKGRAVASVFTGFCKYHDKILFQPIEDHDFTGTIEQVFLFTYRTMAWHYHKKEEQYNRMILQKNHFKEKGFLPNKEFDIFEKYMQLGLKDNQIEKDIFDKALLLKEYSCIHYLIWELPYEVSFTVSMTHEIDYDIDGNLINDIHSTLPLKKIYLNIFPASGNSFCIWSWLDINDSVFQPFAKQFSALSTEYKKTI